MTLNNQEQESNVVLNEKIYQVMKSKPLYKRMLKTFLDFYPKYKEANIEEQYQQMFELEFAI